MENNLSLYRIFYATAQAGNISLAAKKLFISQPAVSKAISKLELSLGTTLFMRSPKGVSLTYEGELLYEKAKIAFDALNSGEELLKHVIEFGEGHIKFGVSTTLCKYVLLPYLKRFMEDNPNVDISIECQSSYKTLQYLEQGKIDIGLIGYPENTKEPLKNLHYFPIAQIEDIFVATKGYFNSLPGVEPLNHATLLMLDQENITRQYIEHYLYSRQIVPHKMIEATSMELLIEFAKIGLGAGCVIKEFVKQELTDGSLIQLPLKAAIPKRSIGFVYANGPLSSSASDKFVAFVKSYSVL